MEKIRIPEGVGEQGAIEDIGEAVARASLCTPALLQAVVEELSALNASMYWQTRMMYLRNKSDGLLDPEEVQRYEKEMEDDGEDDEGGDDE